MRLHLRPDLGLRLPGRIRRYLQPMVPAAAVLDAMRSLPLARLDALVGDGPILVLAPHPDDETLGCGGLVAACCAEGRDVRVLVLTDGSGSHPGSRAYPGARLAALRQAEAVAAVAALGLGADRIGFLGLRDGGAPRHGRPLAAAAALVASHARRYGAATICATWEHDPHGDHLSANRIGRLVARQTGARFLSYPVWGWTLPPSAWLPARPVRGARLDIAPYLPAKRRAVACHRSQTTDLIHDDPNGFRLAPEVLALFDRPFEVFLEG